MSNDHFYTTSLAERNNAVANLGYVAEGTACFSSTIAWIGQPAMPTRFGGIWGLPNNHLRNSGLAWNRRDSSRPAIPLGG